MFMLKKNAIEMYSTHNEEISAVTEMFIRTLKNKMYKYMSPVLKNVYIDKLDDIVNECNNTYHNTLKMKPVNVNASIYIEFNKENIKEGPKLKIGDIVKISEYQSIFTKGYVPKCSYEVCLIKKAKNTVPWTYVISDLNHGYLEIRI